jgi:phosphoglycolate phosphatase-like HAD superfamily hydrolase
MESIMNRRRMFGGWAVVLTAVLLGLPARAQPVDPLPSWNDGSTKQAILEFVRATTQSGSPEFVPPEERIATFDQDGTLWVEHPLYAQAMFALDRLRVLGAQHPDWATRDPFRAILSGDAEIGLLDEKDWAEIIAVTHAGMDTEQFLAIASDWLVKAEHPRFKRRYTELVYQPMQEAMNFLRASGFRTYIVTGGGQEFVRAYAQQTYGVPPEQVIGSSIATKYEYENGKPALLREPKIFFVDDKTGKPIGINLFIGRRPLIAFGNSGGDREMLEWTTAGSGSRLGLLVFHDDAEREYAYGPANDLADTKVGTFDQALMDEAKQRGWAVVSMKKDWKTIFPELAR